MANVGKGLMLIGLSLFFIGLVLFLAKDKLNWLGKLPGDFSWENGSTRVYFPLTTSLLFSILLSLIFWLISKLK